MDGTVFGFDPGGEAGFASLIIRGDRVVDYSATTVRTVEQAFALIPPAERPLGIGIDTLTLWSTGRSGWRPADRWLLERHPTVRRSIVAPNSLYGAMCLGGMGFVLLARARWPDVPISETHPKVLYFALAETQYDRATLNADASGICERLGAHGLSATNEHEWDALLSALAVWKGLRGEWTRDLHAIAPQAGESLLRPGGNSHYFWPT